MWTVCLRLLPDSVAAAIWTRALLRQHAIHSATEPPTGRCNIYYYAEAAHTLSYGHIKPSGEWAKCRLTCDHHYRLTATPRRWVVNPTMTGMKNRSGRNLTELAVRGRLWQFRNHASHEVHIGATWRIRRINLCGGGDAGCRFRYCSILLIVLTARQQHARRYANALHDAYRADKVEPVLIVLEVLMAVVQSI